MFSDHEIVKKIEEVNFPNVIEVEVEPGSLYKLNVNTALKTHAVYFCIDDALRSLELKFFKGVESLMDSIVEEKIKDQDDFFNCFSNVIIILYRYNDFFNLLPVKSIHQQRQKIDETLPIAIKHLKKHVGLTVYFLQCNAEVKNKFEPWRGYKPEGLTSFSIMARLNKCISPSRDGNYNSQERNGGCIGIEVLISRQPADDGDKNSNDAIFLLNRNLLNQIENQQLLFGGLLNMSVVLKFQVEKIARLLRNHFLNLFNKKGSKPTVASPPPIETTDVLDNEHDSTTSINHIPESIWISLFETYFFSNDIYSMRMFATCSKCFYKLISMNVSMAICKLPMLAHTLDKEEHLSYSMQNVNLLIKSQKEHNYAKFSVSNSTLVTAIHNMDRILALSGGYFKAIVLKIIEEKNEAKSLYIRAKNDEDLLENVKQFYIQMYNNVHELYGVFINNSIHRSNFLNHGNVVKMKYVGYIQIPPKCNGTIELNKLQTQILSNIGQCCLKQNNKYDEKKYNVACKYLLLALLYTPNHTKTLWRLGMNEMKYQAFKISNSSINFHDESLSPCRNKLDEMFAKANEWFVKAKQSTNKPKELKSIYKSIKELKSFINCAAKNGVASSQKKKKRSSKEIQAHRSFMEELGKTAQSRGYMPDMDVIASSSSGVHNI
jgi:hypothetical protein